MSNEERASPLDLLRAGVTQGRQRVQARNLKNEQSQLDKRRGQALVELGEQAWQQRVTHPDYAPTFGQLIKLERQRAGSQSQLDELLATISQQEQLKAQLNEGFATRINEVQAQKQAAAGRLSKVMSSKLAAEQRAGEGQEGNSAEIEALNGQVQAIQSEIGQHEAGITAIRDEQAGTIRPIEQQLSQLQQQARALKEQIATLASQMKPIMPVLGERVLTVRPEAAQLAQLYQQIDAYDSQLAQKTEQIATLEQQMATASPTAKRAFYLLVGTAGTIVLLLLVCFGVMFFGGGEESHSNSPSLLPDIFGGTETYVNEAWGFSVEYPEEWHIVFRYEDLLITSDQDWVEQLKDDPDAPQPVGEPAIAIRPSWLIAEKVPNLEAYSTELMRGITSNSNFRVLTPAEPVDINGHQGMRSQTISRETSNYSDMLLLGEGRRSFIIMGTTATTNEEVPEMAETLAAILESVQLIEPAAKSHQHPATGLSFVHPEDWEIEEGAEGLHMAPQKPSSYDDGRFNLRVIGNASDIWPPSLNQMFVEPWLNNGAQKIGEKSIYIGTESEVYIQLLKAKVAHLEDDEVDSEELDTEIYLTSATFQGYNEEALGLFTSCSVSADSDACLEIKMMMDTFYQLEPTEQSSDAAVEGEPLDTNNVLLLSNTNFNITQLVSMTDEGMIIHWKRTLSVDGWNPDFKTLKFHDKSGIGRIDIRGQSTMEWTIPQDVQNTRSAQYRPDLQEIAYIQNKDVFTLATEEGAEPVRWSQIGLYQQIWGWFDKDTLLVGTDSRQTHLVRRDGSSYQFKVDWKISNHSLVFNRAGWLHFVTSKSNPLLLYQPGLNKAEVRFKLPQTNSAYGFYGWTFDNKYYLLHPRLDKAGPTSGLLAISQDGQLRQVAPEFLSPSGRLLAWDFAPSDSQMVLSWDYEEKRGIFIADVEGESIEEIKKITPDNVFWPTPDTLIYVIEEGDNIGTWRLPLDEGKAEQLFAYRAVKVTATPDGRLLLVANNTLWEYDGTDAPRIVGEEGKTLVSDGYEFVWPQIEEVE